MNSLFEASSRIKQFRADSLSSAVAQIEAKFKGTRKETTQTILAENQISMDLLLAAILSQRPPEVCKEICVSGFLFWFLLL